MASKTYPLRRYLRNLSGWTWNKQGHAYSYGRGLSLQEETITEMLLLRMALDKRRYGIGVRMYNKSEEKRTGADWEWLIRTPDCTHHLRVQAKRLYHVSSGKDYGELKVNKSQHKTLIAAARRKKRTPVFVLYNHDHGKNSSLLKPNATSEFRGRSHWGCAIIHAKTVNSNLVKDLLPNMKPWHELIGLHGNCHLPTTRSRGQAIGDDGPDAEDPQSDWPSFFDNRKKLDEYLAEEKLAGVAELDFSDFRGE